MQVTLKEKPTQPSALPIRRLLYPILLVVIYATWLIYMSWSNSWHLFNEFWPVSLTMTLGSFVAGATAEGGAAVAFPIFTKVLHIPSPDARTFGLMIQAVGMTMAGVVIAIQRVKVLPRVILWVSFGGIFGQLIGTFLVSIPTPYPKILFTFVSTAFGVAMVISRWWMQWSPRAELPSWHNHYRLLFFVIGLLGGSFAAQTGSGIDMLTFIVLTLAFGMNEKISTPTTVIIMGLNSVVGFFVHGVIVADIGIAWSYWLVAVPIVILGAPLGAFVASKVHRDSIIKFLLFLITLELVTTMWLVPFSTNAILITCIAMVLSVLWFGGMLYYRQKKFADPITSLE